MFCPNCGTNIPDNAAFCSNCGKSVSNTQQPAQNYQQPTPTYEQATPNYQQPAPEYQQPVPTYQQPTQVPFDAYNSMPMKWYKFLIYFSLFAGAVVNLVSGINQLTGAQYDGAAELVYGFYDGLKGLDTFIGLACIALAVFAVYVRFRLSGFCSNGPAMLLILYAAMPVVNIIYIIGLFSVLPSSLTEELNVASYIGTIIGNLVILVINYIYFNKRKHLFVN